MKMDMQTVYLPRKYESNNINKVNIFVVLGEDREEERRYNKKKRKKKGKQQK